MKIEAETYITVQFFDLDPMNVVWHGNYIKYLETARCDLLAKIGYDYTDMARECVAYPVATMDLKFMKPCKFNQKLKVISSLEEIEPCLIIKYTIFDAQTNEKMFKAKSMQIRVDINTKESLYTVHENFAKKIEDYRE